SSHTLVEVEQLCDRVAMVRNRDLVANESLSALRDREGYDVTIRWSDESHTAGLAPPAFLSLTRQAGNVWEGVLEGPAHRLVDFLAGRPVEELTIGRPDLESLFHRFYERGKGAGP